MTTNQSLIETLYKQYQDEPGVRIFVEAISASSGFPVSLVVDTFVGMKVKEMTASRMRSFYDELNNGDIELNESLIENEDFLHSYFSVVNYVARSKNDEKASRFARIIKNLYSEKIDINQFEDYTSIFDDLSDREFAILCIKLRYEKRPIEEEIDKNSGKPKNPYQKTLGYWDEFVNEITKTLNIDSLELEAFLFRLQRTGCYMLHSGYFDMRNDGCGNTTIVFEKLFEIVQE